jgi:hypothetical protein
MTVRDRLDPEEQSRFDVQYPRANAAAKDLAERLEELSLISIGQPDAVSKNSGGGRRITAKLMPQD